MSFDAWFTLAIVVALFIGLVKNAAPPDMLFLAAVVLLTLQGVITPNDAFAGFSNSGMLTVAALFPVAAGLKETGFLDWVGHRVLGRAKSERGALARLTGVVLPLSAFLNNTPIVAMFLPIVLDWCRRVRVAPSKLLIPLSFLTILGGTCTLIGTSTNLVVNGLIIDAGLPPMSLFEISKVGVPYAIIGVIYLFTVGRRLLPERKELLEQLGESRRDYVAEMQVTPACRLIGQSVEQAGLRQLHGLYLIEIDRQGKILTPVSPDELIEKHDRLVFTGIVDSIVELERIAGLVPVEANHQPISGDQRRARMCEAVVSAESPLNRKTVREADFRAMYGAVVVAVHRSGARVQRKVGDIVIQPGDTLLLQTGPHFLRAHRNDPAFYLISDVADWRPVRRDRAWIAALLVLALIGLMASEIIPTAVAAMTIAVLMVASGCLSAGEARRSIEWQVLITIAAAFGVGTALEKSGAAAEIARVFVDNTRFLGPIGAVAVMYFIASSMTEVITNNAAAVLLFPFCLETAKLYQVDSRPMIMALVLAASASFSTPIGYQTNMMVYGPGGYRFTDFLRVGSPLNFILWIVATALIPVFWPF
jgi:di/tricarboxylate transporter